MSSTDTTTTSKDTAPQWSIPSTFNASYAIVACIIYFLNPTIYFGTELLAAQAYTPSYNYKTHFTSQLGIPYEYVEPMSGLQAFSPRANYMNVMFVTHGVLFLAGQWFLLRAFDKPELATARIWTARVFLVGITMVAAVPGGPRAEEPGGLGIIHVLGAFLAILSGNINSILTGVAAEKWGLHKAASLMCGVVGLCGLVAFFAGGGRGLTPGLYQRISIYPTQIWMFFTADMLFQNISKVVKEADEEFVRQKQE